MNLERKSKKELIYLVNHLRASLSISDPRQIKGPSEKGLYKILAYISQVG